MPRKPIAAILGCGPSGLLAAHACELNGIEPVIFSRDVPSQLGGAQFSHIAIPGITDPDDAFKLTYRLNGSPDVYRKKVYGDTPVPFVSFEGVSDGQVVEAWSLRRIYEQLWDRFSGRIINTMFDPERAEQFEGWPFGPVFTSLPAPVICRASVDMDVNHGFRSQPVRILNQALDSSISDNTIIYDGTQEHSWYRMSMIDGVGGTEWGGSGAVPPGIELKTVMKPIETNCNCHPRLIRIGRFGTWKKGILTMHAFGMVMDTLDVMSRDL